MSDLAPSEWSRLAPQFDQARTTLAGLTGRLAQAQEAGGRGPVICGVAMHASLLGGTRVDDGSVQMSDALLVQPALLPLLDAPNLLEQLCRHPYCEAMPRASVEILAGLRCQMCRSVTPSRLVCGQITAISARAVQIKAVGVCPLCRWASPAMCRLYENGDVLVPRRADGGGRWKRVTLAAATSHGLMARATRALMAVITKPRIRRD